MNEADIGLPDILDIGVIGYLQRAHGASHGEQTAGKEPFAEVVIITQTSESSRRDSGYDTLEALQVAGSGDLSAVTRVTGDEVTEPELRLDIIAHLLQQGLGCLDHKAHLQFIGGRAHGLLRTLHEERHRGVILADKLT